MTIDELDSFLKEASTNPDARKFRYFRLSESNAATNQFEIAAKQSEQNVPVDNQQTANRKLKLKFPFYRENSFSVGIFSNYAEMPKHSHDFIELIYVYAGKCSQYIDGKYIEMNEDSVCLLNAHVQHKINLASEHDIIVMLQMSKDFFDSSILGLLSENKLASQFLVNSFFTSAEVGEYLYFQFDKDHIVRRYIQQIMCEFFSKYTGYNEVIKAIIVALMAVLLRVYENETDGESFYNYKSNKLTEMSAILQYIDTHYDTVTLNMLAEQFNYPNTTYLSTMIKKICGQNYRDLVSNARLNAAAMLLKESDTSIQAIANDVGYHNITSFYKKFQERYGISPYNYRKTRTDV